MNQALLELLEKKDIEFITVTEITKKAGVNRSTFYLHYDNIYDLFEETIEFLDKEFADAFNSDMAHKVASKNDAFLITEEFLVPYLNFCKKNKYHKYMGRKIKSLYENKLSVFDTSA